MGYDLDMTGRVVLVTGGSRGVGAGVAQVFREAGAVVEICGRTPPPSSPWGDDPGVRFSSVDVRDAASVATWVAEVLDRHDRIDIAVNNAGGSPFAPFASASVRLHAKVMELNFMGSVNLAHAAYPALQRTGAGVLLNISSLSARRPSPCTAVYGAAKAALESLTTTLAQEWAPDVRVNAVSAGLVATDGAADHYGDADQMANVAATIPRGVLATPQEIGHACLLLASPLASHVTGAVLNVDGGGEHPSFLQFTPHARSENATG